MNKILTEYMVKLKLFRKETELIKIDDNSLKELFINFIEILKMQESNIKVSLMADLKTNQK